MRKINIYLHLLMLIGVGVTLLHFFSCPVLAETKTGTANVKITLVVDDIQLADKYAVERGSIQNPDYGNNNQKPNLNVSDQYYVYKYNVYTHYDITITTEHDNAVGSFSWNGNTYYFTGKETHQTAPGSTYSYTFTGDDDGPHGNTTPNLEYTTSKTASYTYIDGADLQKYTPISFNGTTSDYINHTDLNTSTWRPYDKNTYVYLGNVSWSNYNDLWYFEIPIGNTTINKEDIHLYMYSTWDNTLHDFNINEDYLFQIKDKMYYYFTLNDTYHPWPYGTGDIYLQVNVDGAYVYSNKFNLYHITQFSDDWYEYLNYLKTWNYIDSSIKDQPESDDLDNSNNSFSSASDQMIQLEDQMQGNFNSAIGNISVPDNPFGYMGNMFGNSSRFLVHMFNELTLNHGSPFGSVITFSLLLGLAMLMIGKKGNK